MESIKSIFSVGHGPSSSHTMGPQKASQIFKEIIQAKCDNPTYKVYLYGSLALTGKGHLTDEAIKNTLGDNTTVIFKKLESLPLHPNGMKFEAYSNDSLIDSWVCYSIGGGEIIDESNYNKLKVDDIYEESTMSEILNVCKTKSMTLVEYIDFHEDLDLFLLSILNRMNQTIEEGLNNDGVLPGGLEVERRASKLYKKFKETNDVDAFIYSIALATAEQNASGGIVVTAPTCGSAGILPATLIYAKEYLKADEQTLINALKIAGLIGLIIKKNASISGAEVGCQGEVGVACAMSSASMCYIMGGDIDKIEYSAEISLEHYLGLTCDPVKGLVQIPCIERNAISTIKAIASSKYAMLSTGIHRVSLDEVIKAMKETGLDLSNKYKETGIGGLAKGK